MTASFERRAANSEFKAEPSERRVASYVKIDPSARKEREWVEGSKHRKGSYEQQKTRYERRVASSGQQEASIVKQIATSLQGGKRSDWREARNSKRAEQ